jgi:hypothetical protein
MPAAVNVECELCRAQSVLLCFNARVKNAPSPHSKQQVVLDAVDRQVLPARVIASPPNKVERVTLVFREPGVSNVSGSMISK